jgi:hypothetical protein
MSQRAKPAPNIDPVERYRALLKGPDSRKLSKELICFLFGAYSIQHWALDELKAVQLWQAYLRNDPIEPFILMQVSPEEKWRDLSASLVNALHAYYNSN